MNDSLIRHEIFAYKLCHFLPFSILGFLPDLSPAVGIFYHAPLLVAYQALGVVDLDQPDPRIEQLAPAVGTGEDADGDFKAHSIFSLSIMSFVL